MRSTWSFVVSSLPVSMTTTSSSMVSDAHGITALSGREGGLVESHRRAGGRNSSVAAEPGSPLHPPCADTQYVDADDQGGDQREDENLERRAAHRWRRHRRSPP